MKFTFIGPDQDFLESAFYNDFTVLSATSTKIRIRNDSTGAITIIEGTDFTFDPLGPTGGTITKVTFKQGGDVVAKLTGMDWGVLDFIAAIEADEAGNESLLGDLLSLEPLTFDGTGSLVGVELNTSCGTFISSKITGLGSAFNDTLEGGSANDKIFGYDGNDRLSGFGGKDKLVGNAGNDKIFGGAGIDDISGGKGKDKLFGGGGADEIRGGKGNDKIFGGSGEDDLDGENGNDIIFGGGGDDIIIGRFGEDTLTGGAGADKFIFFSEDNGSTDHITDFEDGIDRMGISGASYDDLTISVVSGNTEISWGNNNVIVLDGITSGIDETDFFFA